MANVWYTLYCLSSQANKCWLTSVYSARRQVGEVKGDGEGNWHTPLAELALGELFFCLVFCLDSFIHGNICLLMVGFGGREDDLGVLLAAPPPLPPLLPGCCAVVEVEELTGFCGGETWGGGWCSGGTLGRMQLPFSSFVLVCC